MDFAADDLHSAAGGECARASEWGAPLGLPFGKRCELHGLKLTPTCTWGIAEQRALGCPCGALDGLEVKYGRTDGPDLDLYDFKPRCQGTMGGWAKLHFRARERFATASLACAEGEAVSGLEVRYARYEWGDADLYDFRLKCGAEWAPNGTALHLGSRRGRPRTEHVARAECAPESRACGFEVTRARQEDGDVDQLSFRLRCAPLTLQPRGAPEAHAAGAEASGEASGLSALPDAGPGSAHEAEPGMAPEAPIAAVVVEPPDVLEPGLAPTRDEL